MLWPEFEKQVRAAGLSPRDCGNGHWRIEGGRFQVNWYPWSRRRTAYVNRTNGAYSRSCHEIHELVNLAMAEPGVQTESKRAKRRKYRAVKLRILGQSPWCHWCKIPLDAAAGTIDHIVPLSRGGTNGPDNLVLACEPCNQGRGNSV